MSKSIFGLSVAALIVALTAPAFAQDAALPPNQGIVNLASGFAHDPRSVAVQVGGGEIAISCAGFVREAPDIQLNYSAQDAAPLIISAASEADLSLLIGTPDGTRQCDDDSGEGANPALTFQAPQSGTYSIWIGASLEAEGELTFSATVTR